MEMNPKEMELETKLTQLNLAVQRSEKTWQQYNNKRDDRSVQDEARDKNSSGGKKLPSNEKGSQRRLKNLVKRLECKEIYEEIKKGLYVDDVMTGGESVKEVTENERIKWHHVPTNENPADLGSRGGNVTNNVLWQHGPEWLSDQARWPPKVVPVVSSEAKEEEKASVRVMVAVNQPVVENVFDKLLGKYPLRKTLRICAWVNRFVRNCRNESNKRESGPIKTHEIEERTLWWIKRVQEETKDNPELSSAKVELNLQHNRSGIMECRGRIEGDYPVYLPTNTVFAKKVVEQAHIITLHGGVPATMAEVRERYWVPRLRRLVKPIRSNCHGCARFRAQS
ncbi:Hypothetical predicted protein, partial [Paramuricea clavata]